jgi:hypothetical protein
MPDYQNGKIYKIVDQVTNECYIGSTTLALSQRLAQHGSAYKCWLNGNTNFVTSFKIIEQGNYDIVLIELFPSDSKEELYARESHYSQIIPCVNKIKNQGLINVLGAKLYCKQYNNHHKVEAKQYYLDHKVKIIEQMKKYREQHKDEIKVKMSQKYDCLCGGRYQQSNNLRHCKSKKHLQWINEQ